MWIWIHMTSILTVTEARVMSDWETMTYTYYQKNVKPSGDRGKEGLCLQDCEYIYEGDTLPDDYLSSL